MSYQLEPHSLNSILIHLDSRDATKYIDGNSHFNYILNDKINIPSNQVCLVSLHSATIPYSFYNIRTGVNDKIFYKVSAQNGTQVGYGSYTIPSGNYTAFSLASDITTHLPSGSLTANQDGSGGAVSHTFTMGMTFSSDTQKYTFEFKTADAGSGITFTFLFASGTNVEKDANVELGFDNFDYPVNSYYTGQAVIKVVSPNVVDINGSIHGVYIRSNLTSQNLIDSQNSNLSNILARVPIQVQSGGVIFFNPRDSLFKAKVKIQDIDNITILLTDERNRLLDLNGLHFQLGIQIDFIYEKAVITPQTAEERRGTEEQTLLKQSKAAEQLISQGRAKVQENELGQRVLVRTKGKSKVGRPRKVGRPTNASYEKIQAEELIKMRDEAKASALRVDLKQELGDTIL